MKHVAWLLSLALATNAIAGTQDDRAKEVVEQSVLLMQQYADVLHPYQDPFARIFSLEAGRQLFENLKYERVGKSVRERPLARVLEALSNFHNGHTTFNEAVVNDVLAEVSGMINVRGARQAKQSNLLALHYVLDYMRRFAPPELFEQTGKSDEKSEQKSEEKSDDESGEKQPPEYPELPEAYDPHTKDTEKDKKPGKKEDQVVVIETNFETPYFGQRYFADILRNADKPWRQIDLPTTPQSPAKYAYTGHKMIVRTLGKRSVALFLPPGYSPLQPSNPKAQIERLKSGAYRLVLSTDLDSVEIALQKGVRETLQAPSLAVYTRKVGFAASEWPEQLKHDVFARFDPKSFQSSDTRQVAKAIADHIASKYKYSVGARPEKDPVAALTAGAFQCDMAAYTMMSVLRDAYAIPSRAVAGFRAKKFKAGKDKKSYLVLPGEGHAWVEVYIDGEWIPFDPTPVNKDRKEKKKDEEGEKDEYSDRALDDQVQPEEEEQEEQESGEPTDEPGNKPGKQNHKERMDKTSEARLNQTEKENGNSTEFDPTDMDQAELARMLEMGSLELDPQTVKNPLRERAQRVLLRIVLNPSDDGLTIQQRLQLMRSTFAGLPNLEARGLFATAMLAHETAHKPLVQWISQIAAQSDSRKIPMTYKDLYWATKSLEVFAPLIDDADLRREAASILRRLRDSLAELEKLAHKNSPEIAMVDEFYRAIPSVAQDVVRRNYGLTTVGPNAPTQLVGNALRTGNLNDLRLVQILTPLSDFITNAVPTPEYQNVWTYMRNPVKPVGRDLLPMQRFNEMTRAIMMQPGKSLEENIAQATAFIVTRRQVEQVPTGFDNEDSERITIVLFDTSGSMSGDPATFQQGLIRAFTARAISDTSPNGRIRHKVVLIPFDTEPGTPTRVTTREDAIKVLADLNLANADGGTDIQKALLQGLALIADAQERNNNEPLASANIVLMTDGQSDVNIDELARARNAIDSRTPVQIMFAAIGTTNMELAKLAQDSQERGVFSTGMYREFTSQHMSEILHEASGPISPGKPGQIFTEKDVSAIPHSFKGDLFKTSDLVRTFLEKVKDTEKSNPPELHLQQFESTRWLGVESIDRPLEEMLKETRAFSFGSVFQKFKYLLRPVMHDVMVNFKALTGFEFNELSNREQEHIRHMLRFAAGLETVFGEQIK